MKKNKKRNLPYEAMMEELFYSDAAEKVLNRIMEPEHWREKNNIPLRYRLIGLAFMKQENVEELNDILMEHDCRPLYARNSLECTLIYAFSNKLSYKEWRKIFLACDTVRENRYKEEMLSNVFFTNKNITFGDLENYVLNYSDVTEHGLVTKRVTHMLDEKIQQISSDYNDFFRFYASVMDDFTDVHEKARYYFCKYLYYHLLDKIDNYVMNVGENVPDQEKLIELLPIKAESVLRRRVTKIDNIMDVLRRCPLSPGALFEQFNYYYFEYVSVDWVELLLEDLNSVESLTPVQISKLAEYIRNSASKKYQDKLHNISDEIIVSNKIDELQQMEERNSSRKGETAIRKYLRGELDLDRTTLICFLLYFGSSVSSRKEIKITRNRLDEILDECGFSMLRKKNTFDLFVMKYIESKDPVSFLMLEMDKYINEGKNFYLFEVYSHSISNAKEIKKMMENNII